jgi:cysteine-rich repeat protein
MYKKIYTHTHTHPPPPPPPATGLCGDSTKDDGEACDDGNDVSHDGCSDTCTVESGYACDEATPNVCTGTIYIYIERERERESSISTATTTLYIYIKSSISALVSGV